MGVVSRRWMWVESMGVVVRRYTVEPPNLGQIGAWTLVHHSEVVLYRGFCQKGF